MTLINYFESEFPNRITRFSTEKPNEIILKNPSEFYLNRNDEFFGGVDWENYEADILTIPNEEKSDFILCLFSVLVVDYYHKNNCGNASLDLNYVLPKLGWCGYGPHFIHPLKVLLKHYGAESMERIVAARNEEIADLFKKIIANHTRIDQADFLPIIMNNLKRVPFQFDNNVYFVFLEESELVYWSILMGIIFSKND